MIPQKAFHIDPEALSEGLFYLNKKESYHALQVLRVKSGDMITLVDGIGNGYFGKINKLRSSCVSGTVEKAIKNLGENKNILNIAPGLLKRNRFEILLEKVTELGVKEIHPLLMNRSIKVSINMDRCNKIIIAAAKQCRRSCFPILHEPKEMSVWFNTQSNCKYFAGHLDSDRHLHEFDFNANYPNNIIIGPEGGFTESEIKLMDSYGVVFYTLGNRRLRSETAAISSLAIVNDLGR